jgi:hypothetical protein
MPLAAPVMTTRIDFLSICQIKLGHQLLAQLELLDFGR